MVNDIKFISQNKIRWNWLFLRYLDAYIHNLETYNEYYCFSHLAACLAFFWWFIVSFVYRNFLWESQDLIDRLMFHVFIFCSLGQRTFLTNNYSSTRSRPLHFRKQSPWYGQQRQSINNNEKKITPYYSFLVFFAEFCRLLCIPIIVAFSHK